ncbi:MAG: hypothetical protein LBH29_04980 [Elusimicrobiota bacterium]|jgi:3-hydroxymyristoyl/3-hydroxydecanoyl-(acyl carrier protein) dehydratase|nr:hypothetical protein [Elusimicrobiota bacterium]
METIFEAMDKSFKARNENVFSFFIDANFPAFKGHFPGNPLLPGIVQIEFVLFCIKKLLGKDNIALQEIHKVKFQKALLPNSSFDISIKAEAGKFYAVIQSGGGQIAQIQMTAGI